MRLSTVLLLCFILLAFCRMTGKTAERLRIKEGSIAAFSVLLLALSAFIIPIGKIVSVHPAGLMLLIVSIMLCEGVPDIILAMLLGVPTGIAAWLCYRFLPTPYEAALVIALPIVPTAYFAMRRKRQALLCVEFAPFVFSICLMAEDFLLFGMTDLAVGSALAFDVQVVNAAVLSLLWYLPRIPASQKIASHSKI